MNKFWNRYAVIVCAALILDGCGDSRTVTTGGLQLGVAPSHTGISPGSWMDSAASSQGLLYVSAISTGSVYVYSYPHGRLVGTLTGFIQPLGECVDSAGDVFITASANRSYSSGLIYEYAHGGTSPIATLTDPGVAIGCAVDPKTGDLAASGKGVAIYKHAAGNPRYYGSDLAFYYCGYDDHGNLYIAAGNDQYGDQAELVRLPQGGGNFEQIRLNTKLYDNGSFRTSVQWDGKHMTVSSGVGEGQPTLVYRLRIAGNSATVIGTTELSSVRNHYSGQLWIQGKTVIGAYYRFESAHISFWPYPEGGQDRVGIKKVDSGYGSIWGLTVSVAAPRRSALRDP